MKNNFDLTKTVENGGCSAKLPAGLLKEIVKKIPVLESENLLVGSDKSDDALVYKINNDTAIIQTTDFFPALCPDPYTFGQIAAANALSDIAAMGGTPITALNIVMFPSAALDIEILQEILRGGAEKVIEAGAVLAGGHTIDDTVPKYGLAVTGTVHPDKIITNDKAEPGDILILTKAIGTGTIAAGKKIDEVSEDDHITALNSMKQLNNPAAEIMQNYNIKCATDITGFSLAGHAIEIAEASSVSLEINLNKTPFFDGALDLTELGCIPGASFRNMRYLENKIKFSEDLDYNHKMLAFDAQTCGGLLICAKANQADNIISDLKNSGYNKTSIIGKVYNQSEKMLTLKQN